MNDIIAEKYCQLQRRYSKRQASLKFSFREFVSTQLHIKRSDVFTHNIHSYPGRLFPYIPIFFLSSDKFCPRNGKVLDPFSGSGTVLLESIVNPFFKRNVYGVEINPLGRLISKVKTTPINPAQLNDKINRLFRIIKTAKYSSKFKDYIPNFNNIDLWFSKSAKLGLGKLKACIEQLDDDDCKDFFWVCFSKLVREVSNADPCIPPPVLLKIEKYKDSYRYKKLKALVRRNKNPDVEKIFKEIVHENSVRLKHLWEIEELREDDIKSNIIWDNARKIRKGIYSSKGDIDKYGSRRMQNSFSLIITSPPYLAAQKYVRSTKLELYWLGMASESEANELDRQTIGTERVSLKTEKKEIGIEVIDNLLKKIEKSSKERMLVTYEYFKNMLTVFEQCYEVLKNNGFMVLVVGNNKVGNLTVNSAQLLIELSKKIGFKDVMVFRDEIKGRGMITKRHGSGGLIKDEFVIVLRKAYSGEK